MRFLSRIFLLSIPLTLYLYFSHTKDLKKGQMTKIAYQIKEILQNMKPILQPQTQNPHLAKQIQTTFKGYSKEDEKKINAIADGM
jgi:hypothetical protein